MSRRLVIALLALSAASRVAAQPPTGPAEVFVTGDDVGQQAFEIVASALERDGIVVTRAQSAPACHSATKQMPTRVWVRWTPGERRTVWLCFQATCGSAERELGPFATLDARAREELITVIQSGLEAMQQSCANAADEPEAIAPGATPATPASKRASQPRPAPSQEPVPAEPVAPRSAPQPNVTPPRTVPVDAPAAGPLPSAIEKAESARPRVAFGASFGWQRWTSTVLSSQLSAYAAYAVHRLPAYLGLEIGYTPGFQARSGELMLDGSCVRLALQVWARLQLTAAWSLDVRLGPAIEWLSLAPESTTARAVNGSRSTMHGDPLLFARLGPALRVYSALRVGAEAQLDATWIQRSFGFASAAGPWTVFAPDRIRLSFLLNARVEL